jgi:hypothetical protein
LANLAIDLLGAQAIRFRSTGIAQGRTSRPCLILAKNDLQSTHSLHLRTWDHKESAADVLCARRSLAHVISQHDEVRRCLARHRTRLPVIEGRQRDDDLGAGRAQPVGLGTSRADWIFCAQTFLSREGWSHQAEDPDLDSPHQADTRRFDERKALQVGGQAFGLNLGDSAHEIGLTEGRAAQGQAGDLAGQKACHKIGGLLFARRNFACGVGQIAGVNQ